MGLDIGTRGSRYRGEGVEILGRGDGDIGSRYWGEEVEILRRGGRDIGTSESRY
jgi:hypothetical protein